MARGEARRDLPPLPARASRRGSRRCVIDGPQSRDLGRGGEPPPRAKIDSALGPRETVSSHIAERLSVETWSRSAAGASPSPTAMRAADCVRLGPVLDTIMAAHELSAGRRAAACRGAGAHRPARLDAQGRRRAADAAGADRAADRRPARLRLSGGELRGYVKFDAERLAEAGSDPTLFALFGKGYLAITFDQAATGERYQGIVPLEGESSGRGGGALFRAVGADSQPDPACRAPRCRGRLRRRRHAAPASARGRRRPRPAACPPRSSRMGPCRARSPRR